MSLIESQMNKETIGEIVALLLIKQGFGLNEANTEDIENVMLELVPIVIDELKAPYRN